MNSNETEAGISPVLSTDGLGAWEVGPPDRGYSSRMFWTVRRRNPAFKGWSMGWETLLSKGGHQYRRFYDEAAAHWAVQKMNAPNTKLSVRPDRDGPLERGVRFCLRTTQNA